MPSNLLAGIALLLAVISTEAGVIRIGEEYFTLMLGGASTGESFLGNVQEFKLGGTPTQGVPFGCSDCTLTYGAISVSALQIPWENVSVIPLPTPGGGPDAELSFTLNNVTLSLQLPDFSVQCSILEPLDGGVPSTVDIQGTANFTWEGALSWSYPLTVVNGSIVVGNDTVSVSPLNLTGVYQHSGTLLLEPWIQEWFSSLTATATQTLEGFLSNLTTTQLVPLEQTALDIFATFSAESLCFLDVGTEDSILNITFHSTCESPLKSWDGICPATIQLLYDDVDDAVGLVKSTQCGTFQCSEKSHSYLPWPSNYYVNHTSMYCASESPSRTAYLVTISDVEF